MKKLFFFAAAMLAAMTINAEVIDVDLSQYAIVKTDGATASVEIAEGVLKVNYSTTVAWDDIAGVEFALTNSDVTNIAFEYLGDAAATEWASFFGYLEDADGIRWYSSAADMSACSWDDAWASQSYFPTDALWASPSHNAGEMPFVKVGFIINPSVATTASFSIRNVKLTVPATTAVDNVASDVQATKVIRDGQVLIVRDGKTFNALGTEVK